MGTDCEYSEGKGEYPLSAHPYFNSPYLRSYLEEYGPYYSIDVRAMQLLGIKVQRS